MKLESSLARKAATPAISSGSAGRPIGIPVTKFFRTSSIGTPGTCAWKTASIGVFTAPGQMTLALIPSGADARATDLVNEISALLVIEYSGLNGDPTRAEVDEVKIIDPYPPAAFSSS